MSREAIGLARAALAELGEVGRYIGVTYDEDDDGYAIHRFAAHVPGYRGWHWQAVLACAPGSDRITVSETALVPGAKALQAPEWVPYAKRLRKGDLGPEDVMPLPAGDTRVAEDGSLTQKAISDTKSRWAKGKFGPNSVYAAKATLQCATCAFFVQLQQPIGQNFGVCVNQFAADGHVVHRANGCGAHSRTPAEVLHIPDVPFDDGPEA